MTKYYVLGWDDRGFLIPMTNETFDFWKDAKDYRDTCAKGYRPFVVTDESWRDEYEED